MEEDKEWFIINNIDAIDSPALVIYVEKVTKNIDVAISMIDKKERLRPHVKTSKCKEAIELMMTEGIRKFKCATIAEAELLGMCGAKDVLLAYQPTGTKLCRFIFLLKKFPETLFSCLVDNTATAENITALAFQNNIIISVYIDVNVGMNRTGISADKKAISLFIFCCGQKNLQVEGLHIYDGHLHESNFIQRTKDCNNAYKPVEKVQNELGRRGYGNIKIVAGGTPTFPIHAKRKDVDCSPGTFIYWDKGYQSVCPEQNFSTAALVIARIISLPAKNLICIDLGHKSIASENDLHHRVYFLNAPNLIFKSHSEEHLVAEITADRAYKVGDVLYGIPYHVCPTIALYERAIIVQDRNASGEWKTIARDRKITI